MCCTCVRRLVAKFRRPVMRLWVWSNMAASIASHCMPLLHCTLALLAQGQTSRQPEYSDTSWRQPAISESQTVKSQVQSPEGSITLPGPWYPQVHITMNMHIHHSLNTKQTSPPPTSIIGPPLGRDVQDPSEKPLEMMPGNSVQER